MDSTIAPLARRAEARTARLSSWDQSGRNMDYWTLGPGETRVLADIAGPGQITHIWMTQMCRGTLGPSMVDPIATAENAPALALPGVFGIGWDEADPDIFRTILLRITWDDEDEPAVLAPLGDFFGVGHSMPNSYASALFTVSASPAQELQFGGMAGLNCWAPMPFGKRAVIELINEGDAAITHFFYIDYELFRSPLPEDALYFHANWRRTNPCPGWAPDLQVNSPEVNSRQNLTGEGNYVILETHGAGHYVGCNLSVFHRQGTWWGEGNDMIFIDDDGAIASLQGTGCEDYFSHGWGMQANAYPYHGAIIDESQNPRYTVSYRFHVVDPVRFSQRIKVTIEHGHGNHLADDWASTAYWYQTLPSPPATILAVEDRLPTRPDPLPAPAPQPQPDPDAELIAELRARYFDRDTEYRALVAERTSQRIERSKAAAAGNRSFADEVWRRYHR